jgi:hypothetical protein
MLTLQFQGISATYSFATEPRSSFRIDAESIADVSGHVLAVRQGQYWEARDSFYTRIDCAGPVKVARTGSEQRVKTYEQVSIVGGSIQGDGHYIAILDEGRGWLDYKSLQPIGEIVLSAPAA